jgi:hypothetical protein
MLKLCFGILHLSLVAPNEKLLQTVNDVIVNFGLSLISYRVTLHRRLDKSTSLLANVIEYLCSPRAGRGPAKQ